MTAQACRAAGATATIWRGESRRPALRLRPFAVVPGEVGQRAAGLVTEAVVEPARIRHAIDAEAAEVVAVLASGGERPHLAPVEAAERAHGAFGALFGQVEVVEEHLAPFLHR